MPKKLVSIHFI